MALRTRRKNSTHWLKFGALAALLVAFVLGKDALLTAILRHQLKKVPEVQITLASASLHLIPGGLSLRDVNVALKARPNSCPAGPLPLARVAQLDVRWHYLAMFKGALVADVSVDDIEAHLWRLNRVAKVKAKPKSDVQPNPNDANAASPHDMLADQAKKIIGTEMLPQPPEPETIVAAWPEIARFIVPLAIDHVEVTHAKMHLHDRTKKPGLDAVVGGVEATLDNLANRARLSDGRYATVQARALPAKGTFTLEMELDPLAKAPTFALKAKLDQARLAELNDVLRFYAHLDVAAGTMNAAVTALSQKGRFDGEVAPHIDDLKINPKAQNDAEGGVLNQLWRTAARAVTSILKNKDDQTIATKLGFHGVFTSPDVSIWEAVTTLMGNAFLRAITPDNDAVTDAFPMLKGQRPAKAAEPAKAAPGKKAPANASPGKQAGRKAAK